MKSARLGPPKVEDDDGDLGAPDRFSAALFEDLASGELELPSMPAAIATALAHLDDPAASLRDVAAILARDPALAAQCLRAANSALRAPRAPIHSLADAVARLGSSNVREMLAVEALRAGVFRAGSVPAGLLQRLWTHAARAAVAAREVAILARVDVDSALLVGLLHDVGRPLALGLLAGVQRRLGELMAPADLRSAVDALHGPLGAILVGEWNLPTHLGAAAQHHHGWEREETHRSAALLAQIADQLEHLSASHKPAPPSFTALAEGFGVDPAAALERVRSAPFAALAAGLRLPTVTPDCDARLRRPLAARNR